jgi:phosphoribosylamine--glycine ligase
MKILIIGSGGREHALAWKLAQSDKVEKIYVAPGNGGTAQESKCENADGLGDGTSPASQKALIRFAKENHIDLTVVGPEGPLAEGIVDRFRSEGLAIIGPDQKAARLEASKIYAKAFMKKYGIRAAGSRNFDDPAAALKFARQYFNGKVNTKTAAKAPLVIKADGLAAGKGVVIAKDLGEAEACLVNFMKNGALGTAGTLVVIEEFLEGKEVSILAAVSVKPGKAGSIRPFISARDHKRRFESAKGPNTGGMGSIAPVPDFSPEAEKDFIKNILNPTLKGMKDAGMDYRGFIFFGLMIKDDCCRLLEYNVRLGDPETQSVLPLMDSDLAELCLAMLDCRIADFPLNWKPGAVCSPVAVAEGYPGSYRKGDPIAINPAAFGKTGARLFVAGAQRGEGGASGSGLHTTGGRVLAVSCYGNDAEDAYEKAYRAMAAVHFEGMGFRKDIGKEVPEETL